MLTAKQACTSAGDFGHTQRMDACDDAGELFSLFAACGDTSGTEDIARLEGGGIHSEEGC